MTTKPPPWSPPMAEETIDVRRQLQDDADAGTLPSARERKLTDTVARYEQVVKNINLRQWTISQAIMYASQAGLVAEDFERVVKFIDEFVSAPK